MAKPSIMVLESWSIFNGRDHVNTTVLDWWRFLMMQDESFDEMAPFNAVQYTIDEMAPFNVVQYTIHKFLATPMHAQIGQWH